MICNNFRDFFGKDLKTAENQRAYLAPWNWDAFLASELLFETRKKMSIWNEKPAYTMNINFNFN